MKHLPRANLIAVQQCQDEIEHSLFSLVAPLRVHLFFNEILRITQRNIGTVSPPAGAA
jgi:hypothetical protein